MKTVKTDQKSQAINRFKISAAQLKFLEENNPMLGWAIYKFGIGVPANPRKLAKITEELWARKLFIPNEKETQQLQKFFTENSDNLDIGFEAAEKYPAIVKIYLALLYQSGIATKYDPEMAFNLLSSAAYQDNALAKFLVGKCYLNGFGTEYNEELAIGCFEEAAIQGNYMAEIELSFSKQYEQRIDDAKKREYQDYASLMKQRKTIKDPKTQLALAIHNQDEGNITNAVFWYQSAADHGLAEAQRNLGLFYEHRSDMMDLTKALELYRKSGIGGDDLGNEYFNQLVRKISFLTTNFIKALLEQDHDQINNFISKNLPQDIRAGNGELLVDFFKNNQSISPELQKKILQQLEDAGYKGSKVDSKTTATSEKPGQSLTSASAMSVAEKNYSKLFS